MSISNQASARLRRLAISARGWDTIEIMRLIVALVLVMLLPTIAHAQEQNQKAMIPSVTVTGEASVAAEPDQAEIEIGVVTESKTAHEAAEENAAKLAEVIIEIKDLLAPGDEIKSSHYSISPNYRHTREDGKPELTGYTATNIVHVQTGTPHLIGKVIDTATKSGVNSIQRLFFTLKDDEAFQLDALRNATARAKSKAEEVARMLGLKVARALSIVENERMVQPMMRELRMGVAEIQAAQTPVEIGTIQVRSVVTLTAELAGP